jgi:hypothetical protein
VLKGHRGHRGHGEDARVCGSLPADSAVLRDVPHFRDSKVSVLARIGPRKHQAPSHDYPFQWRRVQRLEVVF